MTHFVCALVLAADVWFVHSTIKIATALKLAPGMDFFVMQFFFYLNNFAPSSQTDTKFYNDHSWSIQSAVWSNSKFKDFIQLFFFNFFQNALWVASELRVCKFLGLECCNWKHCDLLANESPHPAETESGCHPSRAKPLWGGKLTSERLAAIFRDHRSIHTISNYCFGKFWLTFNP